MSVKNTSGAVLAELATCLPGTALVLGASIEQQEGASNPVNPANTQAATPIVDGYLGALGWASKLNGGTLQVALNAAAAGFTSAQQLANIQNPANAQYALGLSPAPGIIFLGGVTGDDGNVVAPAASAANDLAIYNLIRGTYPNSLIILPTLPGVNITGNAATRNAVNPQRRTLAKSNPNTLLFDYEGAFTNPLTGLPIVAYSQDQIHPNPVGAYNIGKALAAALAPFLPPGPTLVNDYTNDSRVSAANGGWTTDATMPGAPGANVTATNWSFTGPAGAVRNLVARTDQYGNWQEMVYGGTAGQMKLSHAFPLSFPAGAVIQAEAQLQFEGNLAASSITDITLEMALGNAGFAQIAAAYSMGDSQGAHGPYADAGAGTILTIRTPQLVVPSGMVNTSSLFQFQINGTATAGGIKIGRCSLLRLA